MRQRRRRDPIEVALNFFLAQTDTPDLKKVKIDETVGRSCLLMFSLRIHTYVFF